MKTALILGVNGQDGSYLAELLLERGYRVVGWIPASVPVTFENIQAVLDRITLTKGDLLDPDSLCACLEEYRPDEVYNLAAPSFAAASWNAPVQVGEVAALGVVRLLEAIRRVQPKARFFQASSSEMFGKTTETPQRETTPFHPYNPYGIAKLYAHWATVSYRQHYRLFAVSGIMFNHESPRRPLEFVVRKITHAAAGIKLGLEKELRLGNLEGRRDWGFAGDYVEAMWLMLQQEEAEDFVIGSGETHSVREVADLAFRCVGLNYQDFVVQDPALVRPLDVEMRADPAKARQRLGWKPKVDFQSLIEMMVEADLEHLKGTT